MVDKFSKKKRSEIMSRIRGKNTKPEVALRRALRASGHKPRLHYGEISIDIAFPKGRVAVFVDGCFWHKCPKHFRMPKSNRSFWRRKIDGNARRDRRENRALKKAGWRVVRVWEHDLRKALLPKAVKRIEKALEEA
jgi:DNA mismatch endonuclease (patch repair protein)